MTRRLISATACLVVLAAPGWSAHPRTISLSNGQRIAVDVPAGYSFEAEKDRHGVVLVKMENPVWKIVVSALVFPEEDNANTTAEWQKNRLITFMSDALSIAAEANYNFEPLYPKMGSGLKMVFTDPRIAKGEPLPPDEFAHLTGGIKAWIGTTIIFQILSDDVRSEEYHEIMAVFTESFEESG